MRVTIVEVEKLDDYAKNKLVSGLSFLLSLCVILCDNLYVLTFSKIKVPVANEYSQQI